jgi:hypothetical protein
MNPAYYRARICAIEQLISEIPSSDEKNWGNGFISLELFETYKKWIGEIIGYTDKNTKEFVPRVLSYTGITLNDWSNLGTGTKDKINFTKTAPENSITNM